MWNSERVTAIWTMVLVSMGTMRAEDQTAPAAPQQSVEIRRKFSELSRKVNELPELKKLKAEVEKAQQAYAAAFEAAMAKEDAEIMAKYRSLFEARIERLQGKRETLPASTGGEAEDRKRLADAQRAAMTTPGVREALQKWNAAQTEGEREAAKVEYLEVLRKAMIEADPGLTSVLRESGEPAAAKPAASPANQEEGQ
jgi:hypothetical protein